MKERAGSAAMAGQRREQMLHAALEIIVERGGPTQAFELSMQYASSRLGFPWNERRALVEGQPDGRCTDRTAR